MKAEESWRIWTESQQRCEEAIGAGEAVEVVPTAYGENDFVLDFLQRSGLWGVLTGMQADGLRRANGKNPRTLNGVEVIRELAGIERIERCGCHESPHTGHVIFTILDSSSPGYYGQPDFGLSVPLGPGGSPDPGEGAGAGRPGGAGLWVLTTAATLCGHASDRRIDGRKEDPRVRC